MSVFDVAKYILERKGSMSAMKLQKLVYYSQAWSLVWDDRPIFENRLEAWANGPVSPDLYQAHKGSFLVTAESMAGDSGNLDKVATETIDVVLAFYGDKSAQWLSDLTHSENPWILARGGLGAGVRSEEEITHVSMAEYYASL